MTKKQRLELTWIGKDVRPKLEPRILLEDPTKSHHAKHRVTENDIRRRTYLADMKGLPPSTLWASLDETGHNRQAKYELKNLFPERAVTELFGTPKPEKLLTRVLEVATDPGDLILDSFAGSGTGARGNQGAPTDLRTAKR